MRSCSVLTSLKHGGICESAVDWLRRGPYIANRKSQLEASLPETFLCSIKINLPGQIYPEALSTAVPIRFRAGGGERSRGAFSAHGPYRPCEPFIKSAIVPFSLRIVTQVCFTRLFRIRTGRKELLYEHHFIFW